MDSSGKLINHGIVFFLRLAADSIRDVNRQRDEDGIPYARKAMISCGLAKNLSNTWEIRHLFPKLQEIVTKHKNHFDREPILSASE